jgi:hypothetical protein
MMNAFLLLSWMALIWGSYKLSVKLLEKTGNL